LRSLAHRREERTRPGMLTRVARPFGAPAIGFPGENLFEPNAGAVGRISAAYPFKYVLRCCGLSALATSSCARRSRGPLQIGGTSLDAAVVRTEAGCTYRIGQTVMRFAGERRRDERGEEDEKPLTKIFDCTSGTRPCDWGIAHDLRWRLNSPARPYCSAAPNQ
jgi:hypothetical protein